MLVPKGIRTRLGGPITRPHHAPIMDTGEPTTGANQPLQGRRQSRSSATMFDHYITSPSSTGAKPKSDTRVCTVFDFPHAAHNSHAIQHRSHRTRWLKACSRPPSPSSLGGGYIHAWVHAHMHMHMRTHARISYQTQRVSKHPSSGCTASWKCCPYKCVGPIRLCVCVVSCRCSCQDVVGRRA